VHIFLSYASEQAAIAESIEVALNGEGHDVFRDRSDLPPGEGYHGKIREAIAGSDLFVFLVSPEAVSAGRYTLTELELAREKWSNPSARVLPVVVAPTDRASIPAYLKGVTLLTPVGNVPASVAASVARVARPAWRRVAPWAAVLVLAVIAIAGFTIRAAMQRAAERSALAREISGLLQSGKARAEAGAYADAWKVYASAAARVPENDEVARAQERLAMDWLENIRVTQGVGTFTAIVDTVAPVLTRCAGSTDARRAADCRAHLGWGDFLRSRDGAGGLDPVAQYRGALTQDPANVYAHAMWGFELLRTRGSIADARAKFDEALASGRERPFVRRHQIAGLLWNSSPEAETDVVRVVNDMRVKGEPIPREPDSYIGRVWNLYYTRVFNGYDRDQFLAAVPAADHVATFVWLFPEAQTVPDRRNLRLFMLAVLQEHAGARQDAVASYQAVRDALAREGTLRTGGRLPDGTLAALARLTKTR
jgi:hypothetical protein